MNRKANRFIGACLLVAGTTIGAGMLALPVTTGQAGFFPSIVLMVALWLFMLLTAYFFLEVNLRLKGEVNLISMVSKTLGKGGELVAWISYLLLLYALLAAYMVGCSQIIASCLEGICQLPTPVLPLLVFIVFGSFVYFGTTVVDFLNRFLMLGLALGYLVMIGIGVFHLDLPLLAHSNWKFLASATPVVATSFGYHIIIPTLTNYLDHDAKLLKKAIIVGSLIPLVVYVLWQIVALGIIPLDLLAQAGNRGEQAAFYLQKIIESPWIGIAARIFAFFAIVTSLLGVSLSLNDFLADGLKIKRTAVGNFALLLMTFVPPLFFALFYPKGFIFALHYAGIFVIILLALIPSLMVWQERYRKKGFIESHFKVKGGKPLVLLAILLSLFLLAIEVLQ